MKDILVRLLMAAILTLAAFELSPPARGQQPGQDGASTFSTLQD
jgi:hypothetical protein